MVLRCEICGKEVERRSPAHVKAHVFCSRACANSRFRKERTTTRRMRYQPDHPLANRGGLVQEARAALFDEIGWGPHTCHWCSRPIEWKIGVRGHRLDVLAADHLNGDPLDDRLENIVAACGPCNFGRTGLAIRDDELAVASGKRWRTRGVARRCEWCGDAFAAAPSQVKIGRGRFCSKSCAMRQRHSAKAKS